MFPLLLLGQIILATLAYSKDDTDTTYALEINGKAPSSAVDVPANFFSFGIETAFFENFITDLSENLVDSIGSRMSEPMIIRVGGTSGDMVRVNESQAEATACVAGNNCPHSSKDTFSLGPSYFDGFKKFQNAHMTFQAPMYPHSNSDNWLNHSMAYVRHAANALGHDRIAGIALGNEPDYYEYGKEEYVSRALDIENKTIEMLGLSGEERRIFELGDIPDSVIQTRDNKNYGLANLLQGKLDNNGFGKFAAQHHYQIPGSQQVSGKEKLQELLMNHTAITERFPIIESSIKSTRANDDKIAFVLSEVGSAIGAAPVSFSRGFGAALWAADFHLVSMSRGVKRVSNTMRPESTHSFWIPDNSGGQKTKGPAVQGIFIASPFITDFVGNASLGKVVEVQVPGQPDLFSAYAMYNRESSKIERVALINLREWYPDLSSSRGRAIITLQIGSGGAHSATIRRMHADKGSNAVGYDLGGYDNNVTWAGEQWTSKIDNGKGHFPRGLEEETVKVENGTIDVTVPNSEAVIVSFE
ncbi:hypothetical protein N7456_008101 [Penicillium angulare]|uniref:Beta-glucuronidase C-terminal domain-containing protein n=1 Tax=Penicillium angulare TaxID=116970 RepID=A0A9W9K911_9EURO|nr:hypothetical protein N7456_008101 [Penicillium angulare]